MQEISEMKIKKEGRRKGQRDLTAPHWPLELDILEDVAET
jgi:hypothetical protein